MNRSKYDPRIAAGTAVYNQGGMLSMDMTDRLNAVTNDYANRLRALADDDEATSGDAGAELNALAAELDRLGQDRENPVPLEPPAEQNGDGATGGDTGTEGEQTTTQAAPVTKKATATK